MITYSATLSCDRPDCKRTQLVSSDPHKFAYDAIVEANDRAIRAGWLSWTMESGVICPECQAKEKKP